MHDKLFDSLHSAYTMHNFLVKLFTILLAFSLVGCGILPDKIDETANWPANRLYREARELMRGGDYEKAIELYEKLESRYPFGIYAQQAQIDMAYAYYRDGEQARALTAVERFIKLHPNHPALDYMLYLRGLINFNDKVGFYNFAFKQDLAERDPKAAQDAFESFKALVTRFPNSKYSKDAIYRMRYLLSVLARYEIHVARYYYSREAYLASANRAQKLLATYPDSPEAEEALLILAASYRHLGLFDLSADTERIFNHNFPGSTAKIGGEPVEKPWYLFWL